MKKSALIFAILSVLAAAVAGIILIKNKKNTASTPSPNPKVELPVNTIPVSERPFAYLAPDVTGRRLNLHFDQAQSEAEVEYEIVYQASGKQEGIFGLLNPTAKSLPFNKDLLLGSQSAGGKITYHEGVEGGYMTLTYGSTKLKEQFNFHRFDPQDPVLTSPDARFKVEFGKTALKFDQVVVIMKSFGLPAAVENTLVAGPYTYQAASPAKGTVTISLTLPAGEYTDPTLSEYDEAASRWTPLKTTVEGDTLTAAVKEGSVFVATDN